MNMGTRIKYMKICGKRNINHQNIKNINGEYRLITHNTNNQIRDLNKATSLLFTTLKIKNWIPKSTKQRKGETWKDILTKYATKTWRYKIYLGGSKKIGNKPFVSIKELSIDTLSPSKTSTNIKN